MIDLRFAEYTRIRTDPQAVFDATPRIADLPPLLTTDRVTEPPHRIAFCITELDPGGAERALVEIVTRLDRRHWEPHVYCLAGSGELAERLTAADVPVVSLGVTSRWDVAVISRLRRELRKFAPELLQTFLFHANVIGRIAAWSARVPVVVSGVRVLEQDARWRMRLDRWTSRLVSHHVCVSRSVADCYQSLGFPGQKLSVIPNGVDAERFAGAMATDLSEFGIPRGSRTLLTVGRLHSQKGFDLLLEAIPPILESRQDVHLLLVGDGPQRDELALRIDSSAHHDRVHLLGRRMDVPALMQASDLFVLSSRWEGMPNVVLEAMAAGLPIVATDVEGVRELIDDQQTGLIVAPNSRPSLREGIQRLLADPEAAAKMAASAQERVRNHFTWDEAAQQYADLWDNLLRSS